MLFWLSICFCIFIILCGIAIYFKERKTEYKNTFITKPSEVPKRPVPTPPPPPKRIVQNTVGILSGSTENRLNLTNFMSTNRRTCIYCGTNYRHLCKVSNIVTDPIENPESFITGRTTFDPYQMKWVKL